MTLSMRTAGRFHRASLAFLKLHLHLTAAAQLRVQCCQLQRMNADRLVNRSDVESHDVRFNSLPDLVHHG